MALTRCEIELMESLLRRASESFANHGCNDFKLPGHWSNKQCHKMANDIEESIDCESVIEFGTRIVNDAVAMEYLADRLREELGR